MIGSVIDGRYEVVGLLGQGGMGVVFEVVHRTLEQRYALKVLHAKDSEPSLAVRFEREARTASSLGHPNIVQVFDLGRLPDDCPYLVMELLHGQPLSAVLDEHGPMAPDHTAQLLHGVAGALDLAHARGVIHRDIKPDNLFLVQREDGAQLLKVVDFGIAALTMSTSGRITDKNTWVGTPHYMAPEAAAEELPDHRADVYSLGVVAFEMMVGYCPWEEVHGLHVIARKLEEAAPPMSSAKRRFSAELEAVIARALAYEPGRRHASAGAFVHALSRAAGVRAAIGPRASRSSIPAARFRVLVVDDDESFTALVARHLEHKGVEVVSAATAAAAMNAIANEDLDLLIVDGLLPDGTGLELIERMRAAGASHRIVFVSAYWRGTGTRELLRDALGVIAVMHKPLSAADLSEAIALELAKSAPRPSRVVERREPELAPTTRDVVGDAELAADLAKMKAEYAVTLRETLVDLEKRITALGHADDILAAAKQARDIAHRVRGTAGTYGFARVSAIAGEIEEWLVELTRSARLPTVRAIGHAEELVRAGLAQIDEETAPPSDGPPPAPEGRLATLLCVGPARADRLDEMRRFGVDVLACADVASVPAALGSRTIDGILVEVASGAEGVAAVSALRSAIDALPPITLLMASASAAERLAAIYAGATSVLDGAASATHLVQLARRAALRRRASLPSILILDDDESFTEHIAEWLEASGVRPVRLHHPDWLLQTLEEQRPDLLLLDVSMPQTSGLELCRMLRSSAEWSELPIVFMTAHAEAQTRVQCFWAGGDDYLSKPVMQEELIARIRVRLDRARLYRDARERDPVSGLLNRSALLASFARLQERCRRRAEDVAIVVLTVDGLANINRTGGDAAGDRALAEIGGLLAGRLPPDAIRARSRGGEFVIAIGGEDRDAADALIDRVCREAATLSSRLRMHGGAAVLPGDATTLESALDVARSRSRMS